MEMIISEKSKHGINDRQLEKYAKDFADVYQSEKRKREELQVANRQMAKFADDLSSTLNDLRSAHRDLQESHLDTIHRLVMAAEYSDEATSKHIVRMSKTCGLIAEKLGLGKELIRNIYYAAPLHDIGKIGIPDHILKKPGKLTAEEFDVIKTHTTIGANILKGSRSEILQLGEIIALSHHEKWDGSGYPAGLKKESIPLPGRIVAIADVFDALTSERLYKKAFPLDESLKIIRSERGKHFDPDIFDIFFENLEDILKMKNAVESEKVPSDPLIFSGQM